jgi:hypothetical protein
LDGQTRLIRSCRRYAEVAFLKKDESFFAKSVDACTQYLNNSASCFGGFT